MTIKQGGVRYFWPWARLFGDRSHCCNMVDLDHPHVAKLTAIRHLQVPSTALQSANFTDIWQHIANSGSVHLFCRIWYRASVNRQRRERRKTGDKINENDIAIAHLLENQASNRRKLKKILGQALAVRKTYSRPPVWTSDDRAKRRRCSYI